MMEALSLGALQGVTEFLPVSSSGHLALLQMFLGFREAPLAYDVILHGATMMATLLFFRRDIRVLTGEWISGFFRPEGRSTPGWRIGWSVVAGTLVTALIGLPLKPLVVRALASPALVGAGLLVTAALLLIAETARSRNARVSLRNALFVGLAQGIAVLPGISRSGATLAAGLRSGLEREEAFRFSFLLSLPAIAGAVLLELRHGLSVGDLPPGWMWGALAAFLTGYAALRFLRRIVVRGQLRLFAVYCACIGALALGASLAG